MNTKPAKDHGKYDKIKQDEAAEVRSRLKKNMEAIYQETQNEETKHHVQVPVIQDPKETGEEVVIAPASAQEQLILVGEEEEEESQESKQEEGKEVKEETKKGEDSGEEEKLPTPKKMGDVEAYDSSLELDSILRRAPVIIFSKTYCFYSAAAKRLLLEEYKLTPGPYIIELDLHPHGAELQEFLKEKTGRGTVPNVLVNGKSLGGGDELKQFHEEGELGPILRRMGGKRLEVELKNLT